MTVATPLAQTRITEILTGIFDTLDPLVEHTAALFAAGAPSRAEVCSLDPLAIAALQREDDLIVGAGYVAAPGAVRDSEYWLQWWSDYDTPRKRQPEQLAVEVDPHSESFNDYTRLPWYAVPARTQRRHLTGPYVDYLCTDEYTLTATVPIMVGGEFRGVVGADIYANTLAQVLEPLLTSLAGVDGSAFIVNETGRVLAADHPSLTTGDLINDAAVRAAVGTVCRGGAVAGIEHLADLPFALVTN